MTQEFKLDIRVYEFAEGGFVVTEIDATGEHANPRAVTTMTEVSDEIRRKVTRWNQETMRYYGANARRNRKNFNHMMGVDRM